MTGEAPTAFVTELTPNDVILGRGAGPSQFVGNKQFRSLAEQRKEEYILAPDHWAKQKVARAILNHIHELGGRFLKEAVKDETSGKGKAWQVVEESVALEKCKQTLRQNREKHDVGGNNEDDNGVLESGGVVVMSGEELQGNFTLKRNIDSLTQQADSQLRISGWGYDGVMAPVLPSMLADADAHRFLVSLISLPPPMASTPFHPSHFDPQGQHFPHAHLPSACRNPHVLLGESYHGAYERYSVDNIRHFQARDLLPRMTKFGAPEQGQAPERSGQEEGLGDHNLCNTLLNDEVADFLLSTIEQPGRPKFTEQQEAMERATMTDEDRAAALCDLFGKSCSMSIHGGKKPKRDLDPESIDFLVKQMRLEIERIPLERKQALMEALQKCRADEFSDARLERFLRCDGMNVKLGAQRFVNYWESRREVFGPEKYLLRMTLSEALRDDLPAVEAGVYRLLPHTDLSGRQLLVWEPRRNTKEGYTSESLVSASSSPDVVAMPPSYIFEPKSLFYIAACTLVHV
jgi:hypothetical protein